MTTVFIISLDSVLSNHSVCNKHVDPREILLFYIVQTIGWHQLVAYALMRQMLKFLIQNAFGSKDVTLWSHDTYNTNNS